MTSIAVNCIEDFATKVDALREFGNKVFNVYSEDDLLDKAKSIRLPAVGLMYGGIIPQAGQDPSRQGLMGDLRLSIVLVIDGKSRSMDMKDEAAILLDQLRTAILTTCSPTGHKWRFLSEIPLGEMGNTLVYTQNWSTATPLTNR